MDQVPPLWGHQIASIEAASHHAAFGVWSGMGSGKSRIAIEIVRREERKRILILCGKRAMDDGVWDGQVFHYVGLRSYTLRRLDKGTSVDKAALLRKTVGFSGLSPVFIVVNYESAWRKPLGDAILEVKWDCVIADEAHRLKASGSTVSKWAARLGRAVYRKIALTGTPTPNSPLDVYGLYRFLDPTIFGTNFDRFSNRYAVFGGFRGYEVKRFQHLDELREKMAQISIRFETEDVVDLPPTQDTYHWADFTEENQKLYDTLESEFVGEINGQLITVSNVLTKTIRLQQLCGGWAKIDQMGEMIQVGREKAQLLADILHELPTGFNEKGLTREPLVIFYQFTADSISIAETLAKEGFTYGFLNGSHNHLPGWRDGTFDALIVQVQSGSESIDLTRASYCIFYSSPWSLGVYDQARARIHRPGQLKPTHFIHLGVAGTVESDIQFALSNKYKVNRYILHIYSKGAGGDSLQDMQEGA